ALSRPAGPAGRQGADPEFRRGEFLARPAGTSGGTKADRRQAQSSYGRLPAFGGGHRPDEDTWRRGGRLRARSPPRVDQIREGALGRGDQDGQPDDPVRSGSSG